MKRIFGIVGTVVLASSLAGCFTVIEEGKVGVRTNSVGVIQGNELQGGDWYQTIFGKILEFGVRDVSLDLVDRKYTTSEDVPLSDFDMTITYSVNPGSVAETYKSRSKAFNRANNDGDIQLMANRVETLANGAAYKVIRQYKSLEAADKRAIIEKSITDELTVALKEDKLEGIITVTSVTVRSIMPNADILASSVAVVKSQNELRVKDNEVEIAKKEAERMNALASNSGQSIAYMQAQAQITIAEAVKAGKVQTIIIPSTLTALGTIQK